MVIYRTEGSRKPQGVNVESPEVTVIPNAIRETAASDSDSDGPILYKDEEEEDEEDEYTSSMWFSCAVVLQKSFSESSDGLNWELRGNETIFLHN